MPMEYEIKLRGDRDALRTSLERIGAKARGARILEDDLVLDTPDRRVEREGGVLRLRCHGGDRFLLTLKGPADGDGEVKAKTEDETPVGDGVAARMLIEGLGFGVVQRYQKYRTPFTCPLQGCESIKLTLDETPVGSFLEVEGDPEHIHRCAESLGFARDSYETRSYLEIHRSEGGEGDMVFPWLEHTPWGEVMEKTDDERRRAADRAGTDGEQAGRK